MSKILEYCTMSSQVIPYEDLLSHMHNDPDDLNEYYMNRNMIARYLESLGLSPNPTFHKYDSYVIKVYGRDIRMMTELPDEEVLIIHRHCPYECYDLTK